MAGFYGPFDNRSGALPRPPAKAKQKKIAEAAEKKSAPVPASVAAHSKAKKPSALLQPEVRIFEQVDRQYSEADEIPFERIIVELPSSGAVRFWENAGELILGASLFAVEERTFAEGRIRKCRLTLRKIGIAADARRAGTPDGESGPLRYWGDFADAAAGRKCRVLSDKRIKGIERRKTEGRNGRESKRSGLSAAQAKAAWAAGTARPHQSDGEWPWPDAGGREVHLILTPQNKQPGWKR